MKAIVQDRYGSTEVLQLKDIELPAVGDDDVLVRVRAAGLDPGVWHLMTGLPYLVRLFGYGIRRPHSRVRGMDVAGEVEAVGSKVTRFRPGDAVFGGCDGAFAEFASTGQDQLVTKPANVTFEQAAAVPGSALAALQALRDKGSVHPGMKVLIIGAGGGVGTFAVQLARHFGAEVTGVCGPGKADLVRSLGADHVIDYTRNDLSGRYDLVLNIAGNRSLAALRRVLASDGTLVIIGGENNTGKWLHGMGRTFRAVLLSPFVGQRLRGMITKWRPADLQLLADLLAAGELTPVVDRVYPLGQVSQAIQALHQGHARGKTVISM